MLDSSYKNLHTIKVFVLPCLNKIIFIRLLNFASYIIISGTDEIHKSLTKCRFHNLLIKVSVFSPRIWESLIVSVT